MRLDKFLKLSRLVKRRTVAQEMIEVGAVRLNGREAKPSAEVKIGDAIEVAFARRVVEVKVAESDEVALKRRAVPYEQIGERRVAEDEKPW